MTVDHFAKALHGLDDPDAVLDAMHAIATRAFHLNGYAAWRTPVDRITPVRRWTVGKNLWLHSSVPTIFWFEFWPLSRKNGLSQMSQYATLQRAPLAFTEAMRALRLTGHERWLFELWRRHGIRDGVYCPIGRWMIGFWSSKVLRMTPDMRADLFRLASYGAFEMDNLIGRRDRDGKPPMLTAREIAVLRLSSNGLRAGDVATALGIGIETVRAHLKRITKKLGAKSPAHAACQALRLHIIS